MALCIKCKVTKHENHQTETVEDALERLLPQVNKKTGFLRYKIKAMGEKHEQACSTIGKIKEAFTNSRDEARNNLNDVIGMFDVIRSLYLLIISLGWISSICFLFNSVVDCAPQER